MPAQRPRAAIIAAYCRLIEMHYNREPLNIIKLTKGVITATLDAGTMVGLPRGFVLLPVDGRYEIRTWRILINRCPSDIREWAEHMVAAQLAKHADLH